MSTCWLRSTALVLFGQRRTRKIKSIPFASHFAAARFYTIGNML